MGADLLRNANSALPGFEEDVLTGQFVQAYCVSYRDETRDAEYWSKIFVSLLPPGKALAAGA